MHNEKSYISKSRIKYTFLILLLFFVSLAYCVESKIDYSDLSNWAFYPDHLEKDVDVFFIAPTSGHDYSGNMQMDDEKYKAAFVGATNMEKEIYDVHANFYAPFYRQGSLECYDYREDVRLNIMEMAYADVENAFNYYMKNINNGRPYILAGFSQGSDMIKRLLKNNRFINKKMIAAYAIGWNFTAEDVARYPKIRMAKSEDDVGVVVSFCSEAPEYNEFNVIVPEITIGINPLNWKTDNTVSYKKENLGACFTNYSGDIRSEIPALCGAYLDENRGTLKVTDVKIEDYPSILNFLEDGNYHLYDYQLFYRNLQKNVETRINAFFARNKKTL